MANCIHPLCDCRVYQERKNCKGTLLELRLGCMTCGHQASEHRQLTPVDRLLEKEIAAAAKNKCTDCIPIEDMPHSPVFGPHDLIPIPSEGVPDNEEGGIPCTCHGFQTTNLVRLWQKFRTYSMTDALKSLPQINCSFCQHSLVKHKEVKGFSSPPISVSGFPRLTLKSAAKVGLKPLNEQCAQLLLPKEPTGGVTFVGLVESDGGLELAVYTRICESEGRIPTETTDTLDAQYHPLSNTHPKISNPKFSTKEESKACSAQLQQNSRISSPVVQPPATAKKGRKRKLHHQTTRVRRSQRLSAKKAKMDVNHATNNNSSSLEQEDVKAACIQPRMSTIDESGRQEVLKHHVATFVESLRNSESFTRNKLPEVISRSGVEVMSAIHCSVPDSEKRTLLLAIGTVDGQLFVCIPLQADHEQQIHALSDPPTHDTVKSLSWQEQQPKVLDGCTSDMMALCAGTTNGTVHLWTVQFEAGRGLQCHPGEHFKDTTAEITTCKWSPNVRYLAAGTMFGQVIVYSVETGSEAQYLQTVNCSGAPITSFAWSTSRDCSVLAVGSNDDCVQLLHCTLPADGTSHTPAYSIRNYFHKVSETNKFVHTHCFQGHLSFISDLVFLCTSTSVGTNTLASLGWDGQILFWQAGSISSHALVTHTKGGKDRHHSHVYVDTEPLGGYKIGPSTTVDFVPLAIYEVFGGGLLVMVKDRCGGVTVINYV